MPFQKSHDLPIYSEENLCVHLRSKSLYVTGTIASHPEEVGRRHCWCNLTQHVIGPDRQEVSQPQCVAGRDCYRATY